MNPNQSPTATTSEFQKDRRHGNRMTIDRLPPHAQEAEQGIIGSVLLDGRSMLTCIEKKLQPEAFYDLRNQEVFACFLRLYSASVPIDLVSVTQELRDQRKLDACGGPGYLTAAAESVPSAANVGYWIDIVQEKWILRRIVLTCTSAVARIYEEENRPVDQVLDQVQHDIVTLAGERLTPSSVAIRDCIPETIDEIERYHKLQGMMVGLPTGFADMDRLLCGLEPGTMMVIAARPGMGKTSMLANILERNAVEGQSPCGFFSLEMPRRQIVMRMVCSRSRVSFRNIREGFMAERDYPQITSACGALHKSTLLIDDDGAATILQLRAKARRWVEQYGVKLIGVDYLQMIRAGKHRDKRHEEVADISAGLKSISKELNVPVIVLSQLNRSLDREKRKRPTLSDLRESGAIEQDADVVVLMYRPGSDEDDDSIGDSISVNAMIAKQRNGPTGDVHLVFLREFFRFENAAKVSESERPPEDPGLPYKD